MRLNQYIAKATGMSRRAADQAISQGRVTINGQPAAIGTSVTADDKVTLDNRRITPYVKTTTIILNKPVGYVVSRHGQGSQTIYDLLPKKYHHLKPVGRLDKNSSGLLLLTNDGDLANQLTHPRYTKTKIYEVALDKPLTEQCRQKIEQGIELEDGLSKLQLKMLGEQNLKWQVTMSEGRNRQIRRTFAALGYDVINLHRTDFADFRLFGLELGDYAAVNS